MTKTIIENLKILSENYNLKFDAFSNSVIFINEINKIRVQLENDVSFRITYNFHLEEKTLLIPEEAVYHFCLDLFKRKNDGIEEAFVGKRMNINKWFKIEEKESLDIVNAIQKELDYNHRLKHLVLQSNRFEVTYFNGLLILEDKEKEYFSNVFNFRKIIDHDYKEII
ncbi:MAG: hypothetical protein J7574_10685 [Flavobacterium sp.]|uniref:hypothetical protein n=1 Tax=Flavobacterium sp. TaxID=239 RepID=UPI001AFEF617|nr:hypothetical protein [Flavobacterium sp.]MBO9584611.1 hypothetical protein [Flavobacterium sp.]